MINLLMLIKSNLKIRGGKIFLFLYQADLCFFSKKKVCFFPSRIVLYIVLYAIIKGAMIRTLWFLQGEQNGGQRILTLLKEGL